MFSVTPFPVSIMVNTDIFREENNLQILIIFFSWKFFSSLMYNLLNLFTGIDN